MVSKQPISMIEFSEVTKYYDGHVALNHVSFKISKGSIFGLLGPNGAGKTTLLRLLTRMLVPDKGEVILNDRPVSEKDLSKIGYLPEERGLYPKMKAGEHIHFLASLKGVKKTVSSERLLFWANELDIAGLLHRKVENLSKGQQQKIQLIACLIHEPDLLILDEPFSGFDPVNAEILKHILHNLKSQGKTIIISTHRMDNAEELCDHIAMLYNGQLVLNGNLKDILNNRVQDRFRLVVEDHVHEGKTFNIVTQLEKELTIELTDQKSVNACLSEIMLQTKIVSFAPEKKTLKEVFLEKAK